MTIVVTRDVEARYRGFLASVMLEISAGVYVSPELSAGVRLRLWAVLSDWHAILSQGSLTMAWRDTSATGKLAFAFLGEAPKDIIDADGVMLVKRS